MLKTLITAASFTIAATSALAALPTEATTDLNLRTIESAQVEQDQGAFETASYCQWITVYDYWGNWVTYWECY